jgi:uncharacterized membrane protein YedE/YeeE
VEAHFWSSFAREALVFWFGLIVGLLLGAFLCFFAAIRYGFGREKPPTRHSPPYDSFPGRL